MPLEINLEIDKSIDNSIISQAYIIKIGFVNATLNFDYFNKRIDDSKGDEGNIFTDIENDIHTCISNSNFVFSISPQSQDKDKKEKIEDDLLNENGNCVLEDYWQIKLSIPKRKRTEIYDSSWEEWKPEEFIFFFNGCMFFALSKIDTLPTSTDIGQVSRELLSKCLSESKFLDISTVGPSPIHPDIYILYIDDKDFLPLKPKIYAKENNLFVFVPLSMSIDDFLKMFISETEETLFDFYKNRIKYAELFDLVFKFNGLNRELGNHLSVYFSSNVIKRFFSGASGTIRKTLSEMHLNLNDITSGKISYDESAKRVIKKLEDSGFLTRLAPYFINEVEEQPINFDLNSHITTMNFASSETSDLALIKATIFASLIGAFIGGLLSIFLTLLLK